MNKRNTELYKKSLFVFRRDLRLEDNTGLIHALQKSKVVIPCFIYDKMILKNSNESKFRWNFLDESLLDLDLELKKKNSMLQVFEGNVDKVIKKIILEHNIDAIFYNTNFTNYSQNRDSRIHQICRKNNVDICSTLDFLLHNPNEIKTNDRKPYMIYSQFYKKSKQFPVRKTLKNHGKNYLNKNISDITIRTPQPNGEIPGGRTNGLKILKNLKNFKDYKNFRDFPALDHTTKLSAHNKFGTVSIREVYDNIKQKLGPDHILLGEIYWREFFNYILFHFPWSQKKSFKARFQKIPWSKSEENFHLWAEGKTGFPIVDAGMRQLNQSGFMHNRVRMIVASFLTKDLRINWRWGERYFAKKLVDYDPAVNSGNWQWAASTGCDSVPYFRIFNPWLQQKKFDPDCVYIKKWISELRELPPKLIHNLWEHFPNDLSYNKPMLEHKTEVEKTKQLFKSQKLPKIFVR